MSCWSGVVCFLVVAGSAAAELPILLGDEWVGCFAVHEGRKYDFSMLAQGPMELSPKRRGRESVAEMNRIGIRFGIEEVMPDGKVVMKAIEKRSLSSEQDATRKLSRLVVRGKSTGDAVFELVIEQSRDVVSLGGRVVDPGALNGRELRFAIRLSIPNVYRRVELDGKQDEREFARLTQRDYLELTRMDRSRVRLTHGDDETLDAEKVNGSGIEQVEMRLSYYDGRRFHFAASKGSCIEVAAARGLKPWYEGMTLHWRPDAKKDPGGNSRLRLSVN